MNIGKIISDRRKVAFYGRISPEHEAQLFVLKTKCSGMRILKAGLKKHVQK